MSIDITINDYQIIRKGLFELPIKMALPLVQKLDEQVTKQVEEKKEEK